MSSNRASTTEKATGVVSVLALVVAILSIVVAKAATDRANEISQNAYSLAAQVAERDVATKVFLGEAPPKYEGAGAPIWAVSNASGVDVTQVWVDGTRHGEQRYIDVGDVQQCFLYTLTDEPNGFVPDHLHFFDGTSHWLRDRDGGLSKDSSPTRPTNLRAAGDAFIHQMVGSCGG